LLPKYKGFDTFNRVLKAKEKITGCTVHYVTDKLDSGKIILKKKINILPGDDNTKLKIKVQNQEYKAYSEAIFRIYR
ncbi:MAG: formyltransferase family protein, partial [Pelagibacteraceae bacterium]